MWTQFKSSVQNLTRRYGAEASFVGRVALKAFLPPGADTLLTAGLDALFEYVDHKAGEGLSEEELHHHLTQLNLPVDTLNQSLTHLDQNAVSVLDQIHTHHHQGKPEVEIQTLIQKQITHNPTLQHLKATFEHFVHDLDQVKQNTSVLIEGQNYQTRLIEEMLALVKDTLSHSSAPPSLEALSSLINQSSSTQPRSNQRSSTPLHQVNTPSPKSSSFHSSSFSCDFLLQPRSNPKRRGAKSISPLSQSSSMINPQFQQNERSASSFASSPYPSLCRGEGPFTLYLLQVGQHDVQLVKWICEHLEYSLSEALLLIQTAPCPLYKSSNFVRLGSWQNELRALGVETKFSQKSSING